MNEISYILMFIFVVFLASLSQILLKISAQKIYSSRLREYLNGYVIGGYSILVLCVIINSYLYRFIYLKTGTILDNLGIVFVLLLSGIVFKEKSIIVDIVTIG